jgi:2-oxoglutarate dehydrogenase E1 component
MRFPRAEIVWCQEEPENQGAWTFVAPRIGASLARLGGDRPLRYVGRAASASTAAGLMSLHLSELRTFLGEALTL